MTAFVARSSARVCIIGTGYVGMATAIGLAALGHSVVGYDVIRERVRGLAAGVTPYREAGLNESLVAQINAGLLSFVEDFSVAVKGADYVIIAVGTPAQPDGSADLSALVRVTRDIKNVAENTTVVLRSTVPVGTSERVAEALAGVGPVLYAPEFLREGSALTDFLHPDRIVVGTQNHEVAELYGTLFSAIDSPVFVTSLRNAELVKAFSNAFLAAKITFANQVANFCDAVGGNALEVLRAVGMDARIGPAFLMPGIGFGGPCFEKDLKSLCYQAAVHGADDDLFAATLEVNERQPKRVAAMLQAALGRLSGRRIAVWGLTFKANTDDIRDSLALRVVDELLGLGASIRAFDPTMAGHHALVRCEIVSSPVEAADDADALVVLTDWPQFSQIDLSPIAGAMRGDLVVDGRNVLDLGRVTAAGLRYHGIGRATPPVSWRTDFEFFDEIAV